MKRKIKVFFKFLFGIPLAVIAVLSVIILIINFLSTYFLGSKYDFTNQNMADIVNSTLEIPYFKENFVIDRPKNIKTLTKEEWMNVKCNPKAEWSDSDIFVFGANEPNNLSKEQKQLLKRQLNCISISSVKRVGKVKKEVNNELCGNYTNCQTLNIAIESYIMQYPELLQSIIKIAERPCDFIKVYDKKDINAYGYTDAIHARNELCNKNYFFSKLEKFVLITIINHKKPNIEIIVRRKDVD